MKETLTSWHPCWFRHSLLGGGLVSQANKNIYPSRDYCRYSLLSRERIYSIREYYRHVLLSGEQVSQPNKVIVNDKPSIGNTKLLSCSDGHLLLSVERDSSGRTMVQIRKKRANEWAVRQNEWMDDGVAQYWQLKSGFLAVLAYSETVLLVKDSF